MNMKRFQSPTGMTLSMMFIYLINGAPSTSATITCLFTLTLCLFPPTAPPALPLRWGGDDHLCPAHLGPDGDKGKTKNRVLLLALVLEGVTGLLFFTEIPNLWVLLLCIVLFYTPFLAPHLPY